MVAEVEGGKHTYHRIVMITFSQVLQNLDFDQSLGMESLLIPTITKVTNDEKVDLGLQNKKSSFPIKKCHFYPTYIPQSVLVRNKNPIEFVSNQIKINSVG